MEMEVMGANPPRHGTLSRPITIFFLIALHLARDAQFHKHISTNCTGFLLGVPRPQRDGIPFFHRHLDFVEHIIFFIFPRVSHWFCLIYIYIYIYICVGLKRWMATTRFASLSWDFSPRIRIVGPRSPNNLDPPLP